MESSRNTLVMSEQSYGGKHFAHCYRRCLLNFIRIWSDRMGKAQFEDLSKEIQILHKSMKNIIEMVSATSPLLALSTHGWTSTSCNSNFLLRVSEFILYGQHLLTLNKTFVTLGNDRPKVIVELEDSVIEAVIAISEGKSRENVMDNLYSKLSSQEEYLDKDEKALDWFNCVTDPLTDPSRPSTPLPTNIESVATYRPSTPPPTEFNPIPRDGQSPNLFMANFQGKCFCFKGMRI
jgi:hypothetical protein